MESVKSIESVTKTKQTGSPPARAKDILEEEYNAAPYPSFSFSHTHPNHLFTLGTLFGLHPKTVANARILELGCASGGNLFPMAFHYPKASFVGIDISDKQVEIGQKHIDALDLKNINLRHQSILDFSPNEGKFDYIICHGIYSWVGDDVQDKILSICRENLSKNGIAYISYNTLPGWNMVNSVKELMVWHTKSITDPQSKAQHARAVLEFIGNGLQDDKSPYAEVLRNEIKILAGQSNSYLLHEHLSTYNKPCYFHEFMTAASKHKLSYLSDAFLSTMFTDNLPPQFSAELNKVNNIITTGQYMDFIRNQRFRCTILCHEENQINRAIKTQDVEKYYVQFSGRAEDPNFSEASIQAGVEASFTNGVTTLKVRNPISQLAMLILIEESAKPIHYDTLCEKLMQRSTIKNINEIKRHVNDDLNLMRSVFAGLIHLTNHAETYVTTRSEKPIACPLVRYQAANDNFVANRRHQNIGVDPLAKVMLPLLDGTRNLADIVKVVITHVEKGTLLVLDENKQQIKDSAEIEKRATLICGNTLDNMFKQALFIG